MGVLLFLIIGTLIFGFAFPAFILVAGFLLLIFVILAMVGLFTFTVNRKHVIIYRNGQRVGRYDDRRDPHTADNPEVISEPNRNESDFYDEGEVVELPASALSKGGEDES